MQLFTLPKTTGLSISASLAALLLPLILSLFAPGFLVSLARNCPLPLANMFSVAPKTEHFVCHASGYRTEIVSLDPLLIYIHSFLLDNEIDALLAIAEPEFKPSQVTKFGRKVDTSDRTSSSAGLALHEPVVQCVLGRAREFMGTMLVEGKDEIGPPQLVRYTAGQRFNLHHDWYESPQWAYDGSKRRFNRLASFFAVLEDNCTNGETHFPSVKPQARPNMVQVVDELEAEPRRWADDDPIWRELQDGVAFRPVRGNALFWVNLHANGTGDGRTVHAGLPVGQGLKTAMNIWPRQFYPAE